MNVIRMNNPYPQLYSFMPLKPRRSRVPWNWNSFWLQLCEHRPGRVVLRVVVLLRSRKNVRWHLDGIRREFGFRQRGGK